MTSRVVSAFFLVSLVSSAAAVDPTGLKLRITNRALDFLKDFGLEFLQSVVEQPFPDFDVPSTKCTIKGFKLDSLHANPDQTDVRFQENSGLQFEIKGVDFSSTFDSKKNRCTFQKEASSSSEENVLSSGKGVNIKIWVKLKRTSQGRLNVEETCEVSADDIELGLIWDFLKPVYNWAFNHMLCLVVKMFAVPKINKMLESLTMKETLYELQSAQNKEIFRIDYSLSDDVTMTSDYLDVPFKGVIFRQGETVDLNSIQSRRDPVFTESDQMAYLGVSEFFFNSATMSLYKAGPFPVDPAKMNWLERTGIWLLGISKGLFEVKLSKAPIIRITTNGVSTTVNVEAKPLAEPADENQILHVECQLNMKVNIKGKYLIPHFESSPKCELKPETFSRKATGWFINNFSGLLNMLLWIKSGKIPLPEGVDFTEGKIEYHDGFIVIGGSLNFTPAGRQHVLDVIGR